MTFDLISVGQLDAIPEEEGSAPATPIREEVTTPLIKVDTPPVEPSSTGEEAESTSVTPDPPSESPTAPPETDPSTPSPIHSVSVPTPPICHALVSLVMVCTQSSEDLVSTKSDEATPTKNEEATPTTSDDVTTTKNEEATPTKSEEATPTLDQGRRSSEGDVPVVTKSQIKKTSHSQPGSPKVRRAPSPSPSTGSENSSLAESATPVKPPPSPCVIGEKVIVVL